MHATLWCTILNILPIPKQTAMASPSDSARKWCGLPKHRLPLVCFKLLCMIAISKPSVDHWEDLRILSKPPVDQCEDLREPSATNSTAEKFEKHKKMLINRFENMNITAGLVLTSSAVFISTNPPIPPLMPYTSHGSYTLLVSSFVAALLSLMSGTSVLIIYDTCYANYDLLQSFTTSRWRLISCLILMAFPTLALVVSTMTLIAAVFIAGLTSDKLFMKILTGGICGLLGFLSVLAIFVFNAPIAKVISPVNKDGVAPAVMESGGVGGRTENGVKH
ncbi:hypothetical protein DEU56DRAFT_590883 [Suillus clintonianus]|uniref:uncharacterized protein n=1 Tax=Suillus clintonianus TaxID=1904413 RepID=UPI001B865F25|nr:uncharacterized protein DEU56DRAFT_590883 [Suillus clintonianus]KAG2124835.1 hypothetical protein DEU56DRAFT_590883 [Suillus clintonianus]